MRKYLLALCLTLPLAAQPAPPDSAGIYDKLWVQTSADYRAHCLQTYGWATRTLRTLAEVHPQRDREGRLVLKVAVQNGSRVEMVERPRAVVMDLDDTVIDMSAYRAFLYATKRDFESSTWDMFVAYLADHPEACRGVPGAVDFIREAEKLGFTVFFISNRTEPYRTHTIKVLERLGVGMQNIEDRVLLDPGKNEDNRLARQFLTSLGQDESSPLGQAMLNGQARKERRRFQVALKYRASVFVGDDLGDFISFVKDPNATPEQVIQARYQAIEDVRERWGREYFFLPNPMYGNWSPHGTLPASGAARLLRDDGFVEYFRAQETGADHINTR